MRLRHGWAKYCSAGFLIFLFLCHLYFPVVSYLSRPLIIEDYLKKADAIVVLGGGVEDGILSAQSVDRVQEAVRLYKQGYSPYIIFTGKSHRSSLFSFLGEEKRAVSSINQDNEALTMSKLGITLGVPERNILREQLARNTRENAVFTKQILEKKGWDRIILITNDIHSGRAVLSFTKVGINVISRPAGMDPLLIQAGWQQVSAYPWLLYEYLGLGWYYLRGWL